MKNNDDEDFAILGSNNVTKEAFENGAILKENCNTTSCSRLFEIKHTCAIMYMHAP